MCILVLLCCLVRGVVDGESVAWFSRQGLAVLVEGGFGRVERVLFCVCGMGILSHTSFC